MDTARAVLTQALQEAGAPAVWTEWCTDDPGCPESRLGFGSPTILVNGRDVAPGPHPWTPPQEGQGPRCRVYREEGDLLRAPPKARVLRAVLRALEPDVV